mmetsp:Transcript_36688/g.41849  ORF Transcript_36688/g.41849 Transcript_36688/m.41849 type:complete len:222 (+) Transcript_36688:170-835(+)
MLGQQPDLIALCKGALISTRVKLECQIAEADDEKDKKNKGDKEYYEQVFSKASSVGLLKRRQEDTTSKHKKRKTDTTNNIKKFGHTWKYLKKACSNALQQQRDDYLSSSTIPSLVCDAAFRCDREQQPALLGNVIVAGGGACLGPTDQALPDFIRENVESVIHQHTPGWRVKVLSPNFQERSVCSWLGGSILGSLGTFHDMWITKDEYDEWGSAIVNRKCP